MSRQPIAVPVNGLGFNLAAWDEDINTDPSHWVQAVHAILDIGVRRLTMVPYWFVDPDTTQVYERSQRGQDRGPSSEVISAVMQAGHDLGMEMSLKPMIEIDTSEDLGDVWRGTLKVERNRLEAFFDSYGAFIRRMARLAARHHADRFYVGSELASLTNGKTALPYWTTLIGQTRALTPANCHLSYAANYDEYDELLFWPQLDEIGIDAYFKLGSRSEARGAGQPGTELMVRRWRRRFAKLKKFAMRQKRKIVFSEFGLIPYEYASTEPWNWHPQKDTDTGETRSFDPLEQSHGIESLLIAMQDAQDWLSAVDFWHWQVPGSEGSLYNINDHNAVGKLIRQYANRRWPSGVR